MTLPQQINSINNPLRELVEKALENYFSQIGNQTFPRDVYKMVMEEIEVPLLRATLTYAKNNQSLAAEILGINRNTLRKKLQNYKLNPALLSK